ncbi:hypothetical protein NUM3379_43010 [Kineococcus sp. NUM-3379]
MLQEYDIVELVHSHDSGLAAGTRGVVLMVYLDEPRGYEVEFVDSSGQTVALLTVIETDVRPIRG